VPVAVGQGGAVTLPRAPLALPGVLLWHIVERASAPASPPPPPRVSAFAKAANASLVAGAREVIVRWSCAAASRAVLSYVVQASSAGAGGPWATVNGAPAPADVMCSFAFAAAVDQAEGAFYRVAGVDYFGRQGAFSAPVACTPWPAYGEDE
jgi:hypothetical protein